MHIKTILKLLPVGLLSLGLLVIVIYQNKPTNTNSDASFGWKFPVARLPSTGSNQKLLAYSDIRDPGGIPQGLPVRLQIPIIGIDSAIEDALITSDGRMDVPVGSVNVAWFALGPHPGQVGSAVIGGHFGIENGVPFVFYNLDKLKIGDKIYVVDDKNDTLAFIVRKIDSFDRNDDATAVFTSSDGLAHLNLITCEGIWNQVNGTYPQRLVVFTDAIPSEGGVVVNQKIAKQIISMPIVTPTVRKSNVKNNLSVPEIISLSVQDLYATPIDGIITSLLFITIAFLLFKIFRRYYGR